mmetsp:Transcript_18872/g.49521  ORF Transcript_18872/g.49521 Transcript_18872/m.49521 type:complete len:143 (-) Transcript_18872:756-1184(-)
MLPPVADDSAVDPQLVAVVVLIPCVCMILGEAMMTVQVNRWVQAASQNLSAGIILGALSNEIQPMVTGLLAGQSYISAMLAVSVGSTFALALNFLIARIGTSSSTTSPLTLFPASLPRAHACYVCTACVSPLSCSNYRGGGR